MHLQKDFYDYKHPLITLKSPHKTQTLDAASQNPVIFRDIRKNVMRKTKKKQAQQSEISDLFFADKLNLNDRSKIRTHYECRKITYSDT